MSRTEANTKLRDDYIHWLADQLREESDDNGHTYRELIELMFDKPFVFTIQMDENRVEDGLALRTEFGYAHYSRATHKQMERLGPCSFLEVLIGLSRRLSFNAGGSALGWAWQLMGNLDLHEKFDPLTLSRAVEAEEIMDTVIRRSYSPDGTGGFFPLTRSDDDQTRIELWYQMHSYINEMHPRH